MALIERIEHTTKAGYWTGAIPLNYRYTAGRAGQKFLAHLKDTGELLATRSEASGVTYVPPMIYCERTLERIEDNYVSLQARGTVHAFTVCHETYDGTPKEEPSIVAMIRIDGSDGGLVHWLGDVDANDVKIGMTVHAVMKPASERKGSVLDIKHFAPAS